MYFKDIHTGKVFKSERATSVNSIEISEEEFLANLPRPTRSKTLPQLELQAEGIEGIKSGVLGNDQEGTKTIELDAETGSALFAKGLTTIGGDGALNVTQATLGAVAAKFSNSKGNGFNVYASNTSSETIGVFRFADVAGNMVDLVFNSISKIITYKNSEIVNISTLNNYQPLLNYVPVQQGTGVGQSANIVKIGYSQATGRTKITIDVTDMGNIVTDTYLNAGTLPASFSSLTSIGSFVANGGISANNTIGITKGILAVSGSGDVNGYGASITTPNGIYAPNGTSQFGVISTARIVVNGAAKDWGGGRISTGFVHARYFRAATKDSGFDMDIQDRPILEGIGGDARVALLQDINNYMPVITHTNLYADHGSTRDWSFTRSIPAPASNRLIRVYPSTFSGGGGGDQRSAFWANVTDGTDFVISGANTANTLGNGIQYSYITSTIGGVLEEPVYFIERKEDGIICATITTYSIDEWLEFLQRDNLLEVTQQLANDVTNLSFAKGNVATYDGTQLKFKYTDQELKIVIDHLELNNTAKSLLNQSDRFELPLYQNNMTELEQLEFSQWRAQLLDVAMGITSVIPEMPSFTKKLLDL